MNLLYTFDTETEQKHTISLRRYVALCKALGYKDRLKQLMSEPIYTTMEELDTINTNKNRKHGRNQFNQSVVRPLP